MEKIKMIKKIGSGLWNYLKDWKNLLTHTLVGIALLLIALFLPVEPVFRFTILFLVVCFNMLRMKIEKKKEKHNTAASTNMKKPLTAKSSK